jgi:hypothetical protein
MIVAGSRRGWGVMIRILNVSVLLAWTGVGCGASDETNAESESLVDAPSDVAEECACPPPPTVGWTTVVWTSVECMSNPACGTLEQIVGFQDHGATPRLIFSASWGHPFFRVMGPPAREA